jgi:hypothetical protein
VGFFKGLLVVLHGAVPISAGLNERVQSLDLNLAGVALLLIGLQMLFGLRLRDPRLRDRPRLRLTHLITTLAIVVTAAVHISLNTTVRDLV